MDKLLYLQPMVTANDPNAKNVFLIIKLLQPLGAGCSRKTRFNIHFSNASNTKVPLHNTSANKRFIFLGLIKSSNQRPDLTGKQIIQINQPSIFSLQPQIHKITKYISLNTLVSSNHDIEPIQKKKIHQ